MVRAADIGGTPGETVAGLPTYTMEEISKHNDPSSSVWATYKHGVYDLTKFVPTHPGTNFFCV